MKRILSILIVTLSLLLASPAMASTSEPQLDICSNLPGIQSEMPKGYHLVDDPVTGDPICVQRGHGN